ncbi:MAG TPA: sigma-70 family RNA polymerase sigma factor [Planctomycetaceae bacterium]|nr:sigma-70 family RNA polymerase sigma factor [Planctomycetaceae bacterium]
MGLFSAEAQESSICVRLVKCSNMGIHEKTTRLSLVGRLSNKADQEAWFEFVEIYEPLVFNVVIRYGIQHADAKEITQQILTKILTAIDSRDHENAQGTFRGWLYRMTRNATVDFLRKSQRQQHRVAVADVEQLPEHKQPPEDDFHLEYERQLFQWASDKVKDTVNTTNWNAFWSTTVDGEPIPEAAQRLGISRGKVHVARSRIMARITRLIEQRLAESKDQV